MKHIHPALRAIFQTVLVISLVLGWMGTGLRADDFTEVAVEVVEKGRSPEWVRVKVPAEAVPEPSVVVLLLGPAAIFLLRRRR